MTYADVALKYCRDVVSGKIDACKYVKLSCQRHLDDLVKSKSRNFPYRFDEEKANRRCLFSELLPHVKGKWAGEKIKLEPHQVFIQCAIWGWVKKKDGKRRYSRAYVCIPRKNGKSVEAATSGLYMLAADDENGAEIYSGATSEKQALEVFRPAWQMANNTPNLQGTFHLSLSGNPKNPTSIYRLEDMSRFEPLIGKPGDGASPHCAIIDEYHEHKTSDQYDTMDTGMGAREQPLLYVITTAGTDTSSPCYDLHLKAIKVLEGTLGDESLFTIIYTIDPEDDYKDFSVWKKANPNYGVSIISDYLERKYRETMTDASKQNINLCKHLNVWTNAGIAWMNMAKWSTCCDPSLRIEDFRGRPCYIALDLASKIDICAVVTLFEHDRGWVCFGRYYLPEETVQLSGNEHYDKWVKEGRIIATPGGMTDLRYIEDDIGEINSVHPITELAYDPREASYLINSIREWASFECIEITQGPALMSEPMKELEGWIYSQKLWHSGDPVMTWMMGNVIKKQGKGSGPVKYYYPTKERNEAKIDGPVALIMAVSRAMLHQDERSIYDDLTEDEMRERMAL